MVEQAVVAYLRRLADDDAHAVVYDKALAFLRAGVYLYAGAAAAGLRYHAGDEFHVMLVKPVRAAVAARGLQAGIKEIHLQRASRRGVARHIGRNCLSQIVKHI